MLNISGKSEAGRSLGMDTSISMSSPVIFLTSVGLQFTTIGCTAIRLNVTFRHMVVPSSLVPITFIVWLRLVAPGSAI